MANKALVLLDGGSAVAMQSRLSAKPRVLKMTEERHSHATPRLLPVAPSPKRDLHRISKGRATVVKKPQKTKSRRDLRR